VRWRQRRSGRSRRPIGAGAPARAPSGVRSNPLGQVWDGPGSVGAAEASSRKGAPRQRKRRGGRESAIRHGFMPSASSRRILHGKEGVNGSSPLEGFAKGQQNGPFLWAHVVGMATAARLTCPQDLSPTLRAGPGFGFEQGAVSTQSTSLRRRYSRYPHRARGRREQDARGRLERCAPGLGLIWRVECRHSSIRDRGGQYWARTSDPQLVECAAASASARRPWPYVANQAVATMARMRRRPTSCPLVFPRSFRGLTDARRWVRIRYGPFFLACSHRNGLNLWVRRVMDAAQERAVTHPGARSNPAAASTGYREEQNPRTFRPSPVARRSKVHLWLPLRTLDATCRRSGRLLRDRPLLRAFRIDACHGRERAVAVASGTFSIRPRRRT
jgi:hypothetical protein